MRKLISFLSGALFGAGLWLSGMTDTSKVQGWLDVFGDWDPTLAFVLGGAILPMAIAWRVAETGGTSFAGSAFPARPPIRFDRGLVLGSILFGFGWGLVGLCPGPSIAALSYGGWPLLVFLAAMFAGMAATPHIVRRLDRAVPAQ
ncbi:DUF6691 family protein [Litorisediminicola beolgyonensis]|uniref:DUF6691 family protein n=1 Tax=Litorisediminicola beolgyonensis TaxID=1173614 RepID=A0ABW3ZIE7_9RHOB